MAEDNFDEAFDIDRILKVSSGNSPETPAEVVKPREKRRGAFPKEVKLLCLIRRFPVFRNLS